MSNYSADRLYQLLPAVYRLRDADQGYPLRDLIAILAGQAQVLEQDIQQLYESWFAETCPPWVVPYIGDLIGVRGTGGLGSRRAEVANTLGYRKAKGTAAVLEQLAHDVTGWPARVVEFFEHLETTQHMNHVRLHNLRTPDLRDTNALELLNGPFETANHTAEVRRIAPGRGRYNIPNVGLYLWRLQAYPLEKVMPHLAPGPIVSKKNFTFNVLGMDEPLFHSPTAETSASHIAEEINVPAPIRRRALLAALASYYGKSLSIEIWRDWDPNLNPPPDPLPPGDVVVCDLTDWKPPDAGKVAIDPVLGRLSFAEVPANVRVTYHYGFSDDLGGGQYEREASLTRIADETKYQVGEKTGLFPTLQAALDKWEVDGGSAVIEILDSRTYVEALTVPVIPKGKRLEIRAVNEQRPALLLKTELAIRGEEKSRFEMNGLLVAEGILRIPKKYTIPAGIFDNLLDGVRLQHTTLAPRRAFPALVVEVGEAEVTIERCILGAVQTAAETQVSLSDSIVDASSTDGKSVTAAYERLESKGPGGPLTVSRCTVIGAVATGKLTLAENSLFLYPVAADRRQEGCVRFCYVPPGSRTPRRHRCQPEDGVAALRPRFTSLRYGDPGYCQLTAGTPREIRRGAEDESEMGAFSSLHQPQREDALRIRLDEYLRVGLEAGIFFVT
jgi:hypothetical protein